MRVVCIQKKGQDHWDIVSHLLMYLVRGVYNTCLPLHSTLLINQILFQALNLFIKDELETPYPSAR